ncbi:MAG: RHS repeat-associated core domain-containing protein [Byssovorax sp.]
MKQLVMIGLSVGLGLVSVEGWAVTPAEGAAASTNSTSWCVNIKSPPCTCDCPCNCTCDEGAAAKSGDGGGTEGAMNSASGSKLLTVSMSWIGDGIDYASKLDPASCPSCAGALPSVGALPSLEIRRFHDYRHLTYPSSFGPGVFSGYDLSLWFSITDAQTGAGSAILYDPRDLAVRPLHDDASTGVYKDKNFSSVEGLRLYDAASHPVVDQAAATTAVLSSRDGRTYTFEMILTNGGARYARLLRETDRNGNAIVLAYQFPANASDAALGFDRDNLWKLGSITDAHGKQALFTYRPQKRNGRWVVSRIDLPNGASMQYLYDGPNGGWGSLTGLTGVLHPDGTMTTLSVTPDNATQTQVLHYFDAGAKDTHRRKDVYLTNSTWVDPVTHAVSSQSSNLVRMLVNGAGEVSYLIKSTFDPATAKADYYVYEGGHAFFRYRTQSWGIPVETDQARGWDIAQDPASYVYEKRASYAMGSFQHVLGKTDFLGRKTSYDRDTVTGALKKTTFPDGTASTSTYNVFRQPLVEVDRLGRKTQYVYDAHGNLLSKTKALGTPDQGVITWTYNAAGQPLTETDANGNVTAYAYTPDGYLLSKTEPPDMPGGPQAVTSYVYDAAGRLASVTDPRGRVTAYAYDGRNRVTGITFNDGSVESHVYGAGPDANLLVQKIDRLGVVERHAYDGAGREIQQIQAFGRPEAVSKTCSYLAGTTLQKECNERGERTVYSYDDYNRLVGTTVQPKVGTLLTDASVYDQARRVDHRIDRYGRKTFYVYDVNDRVVRTVSEMVPGAVPGPAAGLPRVLTANAPYLIEDVVYDAEGQTLSRIDGRGIAHTSAYDARGRVIRTITAAGTPEQGKTEYDYDAQGNQVRVRHPRHFTEAGGFITESTYGGRNLLSTMTWAKGRPEEATESYGYDLDGKRSLRIDGRGFSWNTLWSFCCGNHQAEIEPAADVDGDALTPPTRAITVENRDSLGHVTHTWVAGDASLFPDEASLANPPSTLREVTTRYDGLYRPVARTVWMVELGAVDENDPPIAGDPGYPAAMGLTTRWVYDDDLTDGVGLDAAYAGALAGLGLGAGSDGMAVETINPAGEASVTVYDGMERVIRTIDGVGNTTGRGYDALVSGTPGAPGDLVETSAIDGLGHVTRTRADAAGRALASVDAEGQLTRVGYDANGNLVSSRDPNGVGQDCVLDARNRSIQCVDTQGDSTGKGFDAESHQVAAIDGFGHVTAYVYDGRGRKIGQIDRLGGVTQLGYDENGNLELLVDAEGGASSYLYDGRGKMIGETFPDNGSRFYAYDAAARLISRLDQAGDLTGYVYDRADRLVQRTYPDGLNDGFAYDPASRMVQAVSTRYSNTVGRAYDAAGRQVAESLSIGGQIYTVVYGYDAANRQVSLTYPDGSVMGRAFTARDQIANIDYAGAPVAAFSYDPGMRRIGTDYGNGLHESRTYRPDNRVASIGVPGVTGFSYTYDADKNPLTQGNSVNPGDAQSYAYDVDDRLVGFGRSNGDVQSWNLSLVGDWGQLTSNGVAEVRTHNAAHELLSRNGGALSYDPKGNLVQDEQGRTFAWDYENLMQGAVVGADSVQYAYDALRRRVREQVGGQSTVVVYDGWRAAAEYEDGLGAGSPSRAFVFGNYVDEVLTMVVGEQRYYYHTNRLHSVYAITDKSGAITESYRYDPYGKTNVFVGAGADGIWFTADDTLTENSTNNPYTHTGQRADSRTDLMYYKNRYYSASSGRFLSRWADASRDPALYQYQFAMPTALVDPYGDPTLTSSEEAELAILECLDKRGLLDGKDKNRLRELRQKKNPIVIKPPPWQDKDPPPKEPAGEVVDPPPKEPAGEVVDPPPKEPAGEVVDPPPKEPAGEVVDPPLPEGGGGRPRPGDPMPIVRPRPDYPGDNMPIINPPPPGQRPNPHPTFAF